MDDKEKDLMYDADDEINKDNAPADNSSADDEQQDKVSYETNDNWEFDAQAPTLSDDYFQNNDKFIVDDDKIGDDKADSAQAENSDDSKKNDSKIPANDENHIVISKEPLKFIPVALITLAVVIVLVVLGVRYYTVPNGKEGDKMNPASIAVTVDGENISIGMFNYYFSSVVNYYEQYAAYGYFDLDTTKDYSTQFTENEAGEQITWLERFKSEAMDEIETTAALYKAGIEAGITLTDMQKETIDTQIGTLKTNASNANISLNEYLSQNIGEYCTEDTIRLILEQYFITFNYKGKLATQRDYTDDEINKYFEDHKDDYYKINYCFIALPYDNSSEEKINASNEELKKYEAQITDRDSIIKLIPTIYKDYIDQEVASATQNDSSLSEEEARKNALKNYEASIDGYMLGNEEPFGKDIKEWLFSEQTKIGEKNYHIDEEAGYAYIILKTEAPALLEEDTYSVRHILVVPSNQEDENVAQTQQESTEELTQEDWQRAEKKAQDLLDKFNSGDKSEYSFALLAEENSDDTASTSNSSANNYGGLYETTKLNTMVPEFEKWSMDKSRKFGDTGIIKSEYGYHIMFFVEARPEYQSKIITDMRNAKIDSIVDKAEFKPHERVISKAMSDLFAKKQSANVQQQNEAQPTTAPVQE